jgi:hypothetical protein
MQILLSELEGIFKVIEIGVKTKFKDLEDNLFLSIKKVKNPEKLEKIIIALFKMNDAEEFKVFIEKTIEVNPKHT